MRYYFILFFATVMCICPCKQPDSKSTNLEKIQWEVKNTLTAYARDISTGGLLQEFKYLDSTAQFYWIPPGYTSAIGYDSVKNILLRAAPTLKSITNEYHDLKIFPISVEYANYTAIVKSKSVDTTNKEFHNTLLESGTLIKRIDGWKLMSGHTSVIE